MVFLLAATTALTWAGRSGWKLGSKRAERTDYQWVALSAYWDAGWAACSAASMVDVMVARKDTLMADWKVFLSAVWRAGLRVLETADQMEPSQAVQ